MFSNATRNAPSGANACVVEIARGGDSWRGGAADLETAGRGAGAAFELSGAAVELAGAGLEIAGTGFEFLNAGADRFGTAVEIPGSNSIANNASPHHGLGTMAPRAAVVIDRSRRT